MNVDESLIRQAARLTGVKEKTAFVRRGLEALIALESSRRLAPLGGSEKALRPTGLRPPGGCALWTLDQRLREVAARLGVAVSRAG